VTTSILFNDDVTIHTYTVAGFPNINCCVAGHVLTLDVSAVYWKLMDFTLTDKIVTIFFFEMFYDMPFSLFKTAA
jgi:hypothetical protein